MDVKLPKLGEGAESGSVVSILVKEGDRIEKGQTILELENEKAVAPIPANASGTVTRIRVKEGDKISVGQVILTLSEGNGEGTATPAKTKATEKRKAAPPSEDEEDEDEPAADDQTGDSDDGEDESEEEEATHAVSVAAAPSVRKVARDLGIDLKRIRGSERGGRIVLADLKAYIARLQKAAAEKRGARTSAALPAAPSIDYARWGGILKKPMSSLRQTISRRMSDNWTSIPHVTQFDEADITSLLQLRKKHASAYDAKGAKLTLTPLVIKAVVAALKKHPTFNSSLDEAAQEIILKEYFNMGIAVDSEHGLMVPVVRHADKKSTLELAVEVASLAEKARDRKLSTDELQGGTFTISNQGGIGGAHFTPIINKPEAAILGLGRGVVKAVVRENQIQMRTVLPVAISYDHRIIDGGTAARFTVDLIQLLQEFKEADVQL